MYDGVRSLDDSLREIAKHKPDVIIDDYIQLIDVSNVREGRRFEIEKIIYLKNKDLTNQSHIFISGLPRSGTTSLLNFIYLSNQFASLKYKNMPFVLSPNFSKLFNKKNILKKERLHADGITYDINSPEAFDEVFFSNDEEFIKNELSNYIQLILNSENKFQ